MPSLECRETCEADYNVHYSHDLHYGKSFYHVDAANIQQEIYENGPLSAGFQFFEDFFDYKSGVYQHVIGEYEGGHAIKILG